MTISKKTFINKRRKEGYYKESKKLNVRARSYFKLEQIDRKYNLIKPFMSILDLGCAPGSWLEYIEKKLTGKRYYLTGIDLLEVKDKHKFGENTKIICDDFKYLSEYHSIEDFDLIVSDMSPEFCGDNQVDRGRCHKLNLKTIEYCETYLKKSGNLLFKTFEGEDLQYVRKRALEVFGIIKEYKPRSSKKVSSEVFIICFRKKK